MQSLKLNRDGDLVMRNGDLQLVDNKVELAQTIRTLLQTNKNEWFLNPEMGFEHSVVLGVKAIDQEELNSALQDVASQINEIDRIENIQVDQDRKTRKV